MDTKQVAAEAGTTARHFGGAWTALIVVLVAVGAGIHFWAGRVDARVNTAISTLERIDADLCRHEAGSEQRFGRMVELLTAICVNSADSPAEHARCHGVEPRPAR